MNSEKEQRTLVIFAKEPKDGKVKTRLLNNLPPKAVTSLYKAFIKDILRISLKAQVNQRIIYYTGGQPPLAFLDQFRKKFFLKRQQGRTLGVRMYRAFDRTLNKENTKTVIIGTDCLSLTEKDIDIAFKKLSHYDCVLGPSRDGGYYLIGLKRPNKRLFQNVVWSSDTVLSSTLQKAKRLNWRVCLLREREDIDTFAALQRLKQSIKNMRHLRSTAAFIKGEVH